MSKPAVLQRRLRTSCQQRGTTMIEIMVAALVLSAGLLGLAAMQTKALKTASGLATQQSMVQALGAFGEARMASPNENIVGGSGPTGEDAEYLARYCNGLWSGVTVVPVTIDLTKPKDYNRNYIQQPTREGLVFISTFLAKYASCNFAALTEYADYWNQYGVYAIDSPTNGRECDYIVPRTRTVSCTLPTGDVINLHNRVWTR